MSCDNFVVGLVFLKHNCIAIEIRRLGRLLKPEVVTSDGNCASLSKITGATLLLLHLYVMQLIH